MFSQSLSYFFWPDGSYIETWFPFADITRVIGACIAICLTLKLVHFVAGTVFSIGKGASMFSGLGGG